MYNSSRTVSLLDSIKGTQYVQSNIVWMITEINLTAI